MNEAKQTTLCCRIAISGTQAGGGNDIGQILIGSYIDIISLYYELYCIMSSLPHTTGWVFTLQPLRFGYHRCPTMML